MSPGYLPAIHVLDHGATIKGAVEVLGGGKDDDPLDGIFLQGVECDADVSWVRRHGRM